MMVRTLLKEGYTVIVDATNTTVERRKMWRAMAKEFNQKLVMFLVDTPASVCHERNNELQRLDPKIIDRMSSQYEVPTLDEGLIFTQEFVEKYLG
ncbi:AAA family ATPase [Selenomonadales bacterium 4137-cl]|uniref:AAA family ATPase n=1 Tax=Anaeroselena agilis TaxID=3063788 RepID=A0ABU3NYJ3_9FIRM|nr:AAA family ATPase [Selenomonadales bacterium 4137-cl]